MSNATPRTPPRKTLNRLLEVDDSLFVVTAYLVRYLNSLRRVQKQLAS